MAHPARAGWGWGLRIKWMTIIWEREHGGESWWCPFEGNGTFEEFITSRMLWKIGFCKIMRVLVASCLLSWIPSSASDLAYFNEASNKKFHGFDIAPEKREFWMDQTIAVDEDVEDLLDMNLLGIIIIIVDFRTVREGMLQSVHKISKYNSSIFN